jgi:C-terminal processing protease CtpA/Prc
MQITGRVAAAACAARITSVTVNNPHHQCRLLKAPCNAFQKQIHEIQRRIYITHASPKDGEVALSPEDLAAANNIFHRCLKLAAAILAAACLHLGTYQAADALDLASATEDRLLGVVRTLETQLDSAWTVLRSATSPALSNGQEADSQRAAARELINEVWEVVDRNFSDARGVGFDPARWQKLRDAALSSNPRDSGAAHSAVRRMISQLKDPYSRFISPEEFSAMVKYDVSGVGLNLGTLNELKTKTGLEPAAHTVTTSAASDNTEGQGVWVVGLIRGSAADKAGMQQGDEIISADGTSVLDKSPFAVASLLQGPAEVEEEQQKSQPLSLPAVATTTTTAAASSFGLTNQSNPSEVKIQVKKLDGSVADLLLTRPSRPATPNPVVYKLERKKTSGNAASTAVGYIKLSSFNARAQRGVSHALREMQNFGAERYVLDLRGNRGGLVSEGIEIAKLFLEDNTTVVNKVISRSSSPEAVITPGPPLITAPVAVLVDEHTASASEILAGALQDNCRGVLVGKQTYGKGLIQSVYELGDGSGLVLTVGKYLTPLGRDIDFGGIKPDFGSMPGSKEADEAVAACRIHLK